MKKNTKTWISGPFYTMTPREPEKKKRGHGYTKTLCKKAKAKRRQ